MPKFCVKCWVCCLFCQGACGWIWAVFGDAFAAVIRLKCCETLGKWSFCAVVCIEGKCFETWSVEAFKLQLAAAIFQCGLVFPGFFPSHLRPDLFFFPWQLLGGKNKKMILEPKI